MTRSDTLGVTACIFLLLSFPAIAEYQIERSVIASGGATRMGGDVGYSLSATIAQPVAGTLAASSNHYEVTSGFLTRVPRPDPLLNNGFED